MSFILHSAPPPGTLPPAEVAARIKKGLPDAVVEIRDLTGTQDHYEATVTSARFEGMSLLAQHRLVFDILAEEIKGPIHALTLKTKTPAKK